MNLAEKIRSMSDEELVDAAAVALAWLGVGMPEQMKTQVMMPVIEGLAKTIRPGMKEILEMPWEQAIWAIAGGMAQ